MTEEEDERCTCGKCWPDPFTAAEWAARTQLGQHDDSGPAWPWLIGHLPIAAKGEAK